MPTTTNIIDTKNDLSEILGLAALSERERDDMLEGIGELIMESVITRAVADMSDQEAEIFAQDVAGCADADALSALLERRVPNIDTLIQEESDAFHKECTDLMARVQSV